MQAAEEELAELKRSVAEAETGLAEEKRKGAIRERKLLDRTHEVSKLRQQMQESDTSHQARSCCGLLATCYKPYGLLLHRS